MPAIIAYESETKKKEVLKNKAEESLCLEKYNSLFFDCLLEQEA